MFGLVRPLECELKVREQTVYRAYYCGVCRAIGRRCGQCARLTLQYDCAFLALYLSAFSETLPPLQPAVCALHPLRGKRPSAPEHPAVAFAADVNVLLGYHKLQDDWRDERRAGALWTAAALRRAVARASAAQPAVARELTAGLDRLSCVERERPACTDEPADAFGSLLRAVVLQYEGLPERAAAPTSWLFYNLGRWIYLADAWLDRAGDAAAGRYNPFVETRMAAEDAAFLLQYSLAEACKAFDLLELGHHAALIDHILRLGCGARTHALLKGEAHEPL